ncbi:unnamed protein product [Sphenostylis stenocarpa]|uniref:WRKY domain-containing protein n=1 Tax=Sphenostylis stenocarpa TaxID=92480 RepID=A0AA86S3E1_9FABA|nr:unnamed protein product [Sphenostylis stenocarpa]
MAGGGSANRPPWKEPAAPRPTISLPPRAASMETLFNGGFSPGPMTLLSGFLNDGDDCNKSFSQLLAGAMASPVAGAAAVHDSPGPFSPSRKHLIRFMEYIPMNVALLNVNTDKYKLETITYTMLDIVTSSTELKQNDSKLVDMSELFSGHVRTCQSHLRPIFHPSIKESLSSQRDVSFGMTHQQALAQVSSQASQTNSNMHLQTEYSLSTPTSFTQVPGSTSNTAQQLIPPLTVDSWATMTESADHSHSEQKLQSSSLNVDKPADDGYNWRKYGQKQVKGSEFPRSYYKCTHTHCPVKKKVERSLEGHVTAIIYKGEHNHQRPHSKRMKDTMTSNEISNMQGNVSAGTTKMDPESSQATADHLSGSDSEEVGDHEAEVDEKNVEPDPKRSKTEVSNSDPASSHKTVTEPRIIVQTTSEVDLLDDGYRWRKYGQKVVKGNPYPRSYYKCTTPGCNVRKHVERASTDPKAVITTYEGKHNHDVPAAKTNSHTMASNTASHIKSQNSNPGRHSFGNRDISGNDQQPVARLRLKEEQIT